MFWGVGMEIYWKSEMLSCFGGMEIRNALFEGQVLPFIDMGEYGFSEQ